MAECGISEPVVPTAGLSGLGNGFRDVSDAKLLKVTQLIDRLPERGQADALLDLVRDRLATLRPVRSMNRNRLLFTPFDRVLVPSCQWRWNSPSLPRSLLMPLLALLEPVGTAKLPEPLPFDASDAVELSRAGQALWAEAAGRLASARLPAAWAAPEWRIESGLSVLMLEQLLPVAGLLLRNAFALRTLPRPEDPGFETAVGTLLAAAAEAGPLAWKTMLVPLLDHGSADLVVRLALGIARSDRLGKALQSGLDQALDMLLTRIEDAPDLGLLQPAADRPGFGPDRLRTRLALMQHLAALRRMEGRPPEELRRVQRLRHAMTASNRSLIEHLLQQGLDGFDTRHGAAPAAAGADVEPSRDVECDARSLRVFAHSAGRLDETLEYDRLLDQAAQLLARQGSAATDDPDTRVARLRLIELLAGTERALQLLTPHGVGQTEPIR